MAATRMVRALMTTVAVLLSAASLAGCSEHINEPWVETGTMPDQRDVAVEMEDALDSRLLLGQSDR